MKFNIKTYILAFVLLFSGMKAQETFSNFEKEKTYVQTNHVFYKPNEQMYFKIYIVNAENNLPAQQSKIVNFEITDPAGSLIEKSKYEIKNGHAEGSFYFSEDMKGGIYKIKAYTNWMRNEDGKNAFEKEITLQKIVSPRILMKLDFPKKGYGPGDEVLADFSMRSLSNLPIPFYEADYTVMHKGELILEDKLITDKDGKYQLKFRLPDVLKSSDALLNIKINFDGFTESISRNIPIVLNNIDVKFMPEGGTFINGIKQNIAFKILDEFEKPVDAVLAIYNQNHEKVLEAAAYNFGMGSFILNPEKGKTYYARVVKPENIAKIYQLPAAKDKGIVFNIKKENNQLKFRINATENKNVVIKGSFRNKEVYSQSTFLENGVSQIELPEKELPIGICRFTIFENNVPLAERVVFVNEDRQMNLKITPSQQNYQPREKVILNIETLDENSKSIPANLAVSVVDDKLWTYADDKQNHILSWLLMDSELRGKIERPQFYFDKKEEKAKQSLDLVMLTNGYRYFELMPEVVKNKKYNYLPENKNPIYGIVEDENKMPVKAEIYLVEGSYKVKKQVTTENGLFYFSDLQRESSYQLIAKSLQSGQKVKIRIISYKLDINPLAKQSLKNINVEEIVKEVVEKEEKIKAIPEKAEEKTSVNTVRNQTVAESGRVSRRVSNRTSSISDTIKNTKIEEVVVMGYVIPKMAKDATSISTIRSENRENSSVLSALNGQVAGLQIVANHDKPGMNILIRGSSSINSQAEPLYVIDGVISNSTQLRNMNPRDINSISVLKDAAATSIYGSKGVNGVIVINSSKNNNSNIKIDLTPKSYYAVKNIPTDSLAYYTHYSREFSYPVYKNINTAHRFDYRETIYWNPIVETDKNGKAKVEFYNSDANTAFRIMAEGISASGLIGRNEKTYAAQSLISIDAKIPQYLTRTDQMTIPVVVKNNSSETKTMSMDVIVPNHVKLMSSDSLIILKPLESGRLFVKIQTDEVVDSNIQLIIKSGDFRESVILPFIVEEKGFPHYYSIINNKNETKSIILPEYINGSLYSSYLVYQNTALQMFEDIERLKKEPHGCFEQLSSTVYPNIFILDYLKSIKRIDANTESLVIRNLKKGFQKMLSYKNKDGGFGYFSSAGSDVALSAFALLEFRDLKKYVDIDSKIIQNLTNFILSKKNSNGLFEVRRDYEIRYPYSEYSWSKNMYILYALSKIGFKNEIEDSYQQSLKRALATKDAYQLALMANVSANLGKKEAYNNLIYHLNEQYQTENMKTKTTFTGSGGNSANAETLSLYIMALQKDEKVNQMKIVEIADRLMNYNGYYGFGSTQATSLALEVLSDFFAKNEMLYGTEKPQIKINGVVVSPDISISSAFKTGENQVNVEYPSKRGLPYKMEYQYYTLQAPKSADIPLEMETKLKSEKSKVGDTNRITVTIKNKVNGQLPMTTAKIGIPAGLTLQNALLKDMIDKKQISYYEIFDNYLVLYWEHLDANETKIINLDLKVEFAGEYTGKSSNIYLYYMPESKYWNQGITAKIEP